MQNKLAQVEATDRSFLIRCREIDIAKASDLKGRKMALGLAGFAHTGMFAGLREGGRRIPSSSLRRLWYCGRSLSRGGRGGTGAWGRPLRARMILKLVDPLLQLLDSLQQTLHGGFAVRCRRR